MQQLREYQQAHGAQIEALGDQSIAINFGQDHLVNSVLQTGCGVFDRSHWQWIQLTGADRCTFLHNQSSNDIKRLSPGQGCDTVILTSTARTLDLVSAYLTEDALLLLVSASRHQNLLTWFDRYIFFGDQVTVADYSSSLLALTLVGPQSQAVLNQLGATDLPDSDYAHHCLELGGTTVRVAADTGLALPGYTLMVAPDQAVEVWAALIQAGAVPMGHQAWEMVRIQQGRPQPDAELTEDYNPLEARLGHTISFDKGCYIGQETIARVNTYNAVKQKLWGIQLTGSAPIGTAIYGDDADHKIGVLTSVVEMATGVIGLGYVKTKAGGDGLPIQVGAIRGQLIDVPFLDRSRPT